MTKGGKLVINHWNSRGLNTYNPANCSTEIAEILSEGGYGGGNEKLLKILAEFEL